MTVSVYEEALESFKKERWAPYDETESWWYRARGEFHYSDQGDPENPEDWEGGGYCSERVREFVKHGNYILVTLDDDCGGQYQAIFLQDMEVPPEVLESAGYL